MQSLEVDAGIFFVFSGAKIPHSQWNLGDFFLNFEKKSQSSNIFYYLLFGRMAFSFSHHTHKLHCANLLPLNLISL